MCSHVSQKSFLDFIIPKLGKTYFNGRTRNCHHLLSSAGFASVSILFQQLSVLPYFTIVIVTLGT